MVCQDHNFLSILASRDSKIAGIYILSFNMKKHQIYILILSLVGFYCTNISLAQNPPKDKVDDKQVTQQPMSTNSFKRPLSGFSTINFTPPTSPAARVIESSSISTVSAPDKFGFQLLNGLDSEGKFGNGLAIDVAP